ncbi:MAG: hypothetical protein JO034_03890 [Singulisphaera sp.]|nr:hypothetical protein [Singulisphaera sp.]
MRGKSASRLVLMGLLLAIVGCAGGEPVTGASLASARQLWDRARVRDYDLEWTSRGQSQAHYRVEVRGGEVRSVEMLQPNGQVTQAHPGNPRFYGVEGLFLTIEEDLAQLRQREPFGQPKGTRVVLRFSPDPKFGYPRHYRRDVLGTSQAVAIDVVRFVPDPPRARSVPSS